jgi:TonB family protein
LFGEGKYDEALPLAKRVLEIRERNLEPEDEQIATAALNLAEIYYAKKKLSDSEALFERVLNIYEKKFGADDRKVASILDRLALVYFSRSNFAAAESAFKRVLTIKEKMVGSNTLEVADSIHKLAEFYRYKGDLKRAEPLFDRALMIMRQSLPLDSPKTQKLLEHYSCVYYQNGQFEKLEGLGRKYAPVQNSNDPDHDDALMDRRVLNGKAIKLPKPTYPEEARRNRAQGVVVVAVTIDERGKVIEAHDMCGTNPLLAQASTEAALKAQFTPTKLSGQPVKVTGIITYNFVRQ